MQHPATNKRNLEPVNHVFDMALFLGKHLNSFLSLSPKRFFAIADVRKAKMLRTIDIYQPRRIFGSKCLREGTRGTHLIK